jgi:hypothetical protein
MKRTIFILLAISNLNLSAQETWNISYPNDNFSVDALLDLRYLNEEQAGDRGFIKQSINGEGFTYGDGEEIRFWAVGGGDLASRNAFRSLDDDKLDYFAKFLAKKGVNMIRYHGQIFSKTNYLDSVDKEEVTDIWRTVAAMKKEGIYSTISPFWAGHIETIPAAWDLGDYHGEDATPWALMYFEPKFKNAYKQWVEYLFTETNPYTGLALKDDPAVAIIQIKNEDGVFFWTIQGVKPSLLALMESQYYDWLINKYGTINDAYTAWSNETIDEDDPGQGKMGLYIIWHATQEQTGGMQSRLTDQMEFYAYVQRGFYQEIYDHLRTLGCQQLINGNNWKTADPIKLFDIERYTNDVCEVLAVNRHINLKHIGNNNGWRIEPGHQYEGKSILLEPHRLPINVKQLQGKPFILSESAWNLPLKYQAEGPFLIASYMSLTGFDAYYWFSPSSHKIDSLPYWDFANVQGQMPMFRWTISTPGQIDLFPANALMYRKGYIQQGENIVHEERTIQSLYERETPIISEENSFDPNRDDWGNSGGSEETELSPITYLAGQVTVKYGGDPNNTTISPELDDLIDFSAKKVTSVTGELSWDYKNGICLLDAPSAQGFCGFPGERESFEFTDVTIKTQNDYLAVNVVAMDDNPINTSEKILIQVGTTYRPTLWEEVESTFEFDGETVNGFEIKNVGKMPWQAQNSKLTVVINNPNIQSAYLLDQNGYEIREIYIGKDENDDNYKEVFIPGNGMYIIADTRPATVSALGKNDYDEIKIYPNPNNGRLKIEFPQNKTLFDEIEILSLTGKVMKKISSESRTYSLNLPDGIYIIKLKSEEKVIKTQKILLNSSL